MAFEPTSLSRWGETGRSYGFDGQPFAVILICQLALATNVALCHSGHFNRQLRCPLLPPKADMCAMHQKPDTAFD